MFYKKALLASNVISPNSEQCVEFYYYQEPSVIGSLNLYVKLSTQSVSSIGFPLWTEPFVDNGIVGWHIAQVWLGHTTTNTPYQVVFEEYVNGNNPGKQFNIYLDDVFIRDQSCLPPGDCDFENGFCTWTVDSLESNINWLLDYAYNEDVLRPVYDHRYLYKKKQKKVIKNFQLKI